jgi:hypothetical protein
MLDRIGAGGSVLSLLALAVPVGYTVYAKNNTVTLNTSDDVKSLITNGIIITGAAAVVGLIATVLNVPGLLKNRSVGRIAATGVSALVLIASVLFLVLGLLPRVTPLSHLSNDLKPFGDKLTTYCSTPLSQLSADENKIWVDASVTLSQAADGNAAADSNFAKFLQTDIGLLQTDATALSNGVNALSLLTVPDAKYQDLVSRCQTDLKSEVAFLSNESAIPLPKPFNTLVPSVSFETLLKDAAGIISGQVQTGLPAGAIPPGTFETFVRAVLKGDASLGVAPSSAALCQTDTQLTSDGNQLYNDAVNILTTNTAPFKPNVDNIIGTNAPAVNYCSAG